MSVPRIRTYGTDGYCFRCPGCNQWHSVNSTWEFNGDLCFPTFSPSVLITSGHYTPGHDGRSCWCTYNAQQLCKHTFKCFRCHSFIRDGRIEFLADCSHHLAGQTVDLPEIKGNGKD